MLYCSWNAFIHAAVWACDTVPVSELSIIVTPRAPRGVVTRGTCHVIDDLASIPCTLRLCDTTNFSINCLYSGFCKRKSSALDDVRTWPPHYEQSFGHDSGYCSNNAIVATCLNVALWQQRSTLSKLLFSLNIRQLADWNEFNFLFCSFHEEMEFVLIISFACSMYSGCVYS